MKSSANNKSRDYRLPRSRILRNHNSIQYLFKSGKIVREQHIDLRYLVFRDLSEICLTGFIAGKRLGNAHKRNTIKRRMREAYRLHQHLIRDITKSENIGFHGIFIAKSTDVPFFFIEQECIRILTAVRNILLKGKTE